MAMAGFTSLGPIFVGARSTARYTAVRTMAAAAAAPGMLGNRELVALGMGTILIAFGFRPCIRFLRRHLSEERALLGKLHRLLRIRAHRTTNKAQRKKERLWNKYFTKNHGSGRR